MPDKKSETIAPAEHIELDEVQLDAAVGGATVPRGLEPCLKTYIPCVKNFIPCIKTTKPS